MHLKSNTKKYFSWKKFSVLAGFYLIYFFNFNSAFAAPTPLPSSPEVSIFESAPTQLNNFFVPVSNQEIEYHYDVHNNGSFAGLRFGWNDSDCPSNCGTDDYIDFSSVDHFLIDLAASATGSGTGGAFQLKVELVDTVNQKVAFTVSSLTTLYQEFSLDFSTILSVNPAFNRSRVTAMNFVVARASATQQFGVGVVKIKTDGLG